MKSGKNIVVGIYTSLSQTESAIETLKNSGIRGADVLARMREGTSIGEISAMLIALDFPEYEARRYEEFVHDGGILLSVEADDRAWLTKATELLKATGAQDISSLSIEDGFKAHIPDSELFKQALAIPDLPFFPMFRF